MGVKLRVEGGNRLYGSIKIDSAKNAVLPIIAATVLVRGQTILKNIPKLSDIDSMLHILSSCGCIVRRVGSDLHIDTTAIQKNDLTTSKVGEIRGSIVFLGAFLARFKSAKVAYPGGCAIGNRPIDLHIQGFRDLGATVTESNGYVHCRARRMGGTVYLDYPSVGATENLIMAASLGRGYTKIINAAREPEVDDLCNFINACGGRISGIGTSQITIEGVQSLGGCTYTPIPDRIITGSYMLAVGACGGAVTLTNVIPAHNESLITKLEKSGCVIRTYSDKLYIEKLDSVTKKRKTGEQNILSIQTSPYPGFPTDLQSQISVYRCVQSGVSTITENLFESRFKYVPELIKLGAKINVHDRTAIINGVDRFMSGSAHEPLNLFASDLRGGVALVIGALIADGVTIINNAEYIYRGHEAIESDLSQVGANIIRIDD